jgi:hypothetical protein
MAEMARLFREEVLRGGDQKEKSYKTDQTDFGRRSGFAGLRLFRLSDVPVSPALNPG